MNVSACIMKKISLIIPIYNTQEYLPKCLQSAVDQDYEHLEIICVDDGSTDESSHILDEFAERYENIIAIHQKNGGESRARNKGLSIASGDYIGFMDCDDWIEPDMYSKLSYAMETYDVDMVASSWIKEFTNQSIKVKNLGEVKSGVLRQDEILKYVYYRDEYQGFAYMWNKLYKRELLFDKDGKFMKFDEELKMGGDIHYLAEILMNVEKAVYIDDAFYHYRQRPESGSHSQNVGVRIGALTAYDYVIKLFQENSVNDDIIKLVKRFQVYHSTNIAEIAFQNHDKNGLHVCHNYMKRFEKEYIETNLSYKDRIDRFYRILKYEI